MTLVVAIAAAVGFFALVMASIALHEVGHLVPGKIFGVKVTKYFVGFGKTLWSTRIGETEYGIKLIPLGGFVKLIGMFPPSGSSRPGWITRMADDARAAEYHDITPADRGHLFYEKKIWQRIIIMAGGPLMNVFLAFAIFLGVNMLHGQYRSTLSVASVSECVIAADRAQQTCQPGDPETPAAQMGVKVGDEIFSFNGNVVGSWAELAVLIRANRDQPATLVVKRDGKQVTLPTVNTVVSGRPDLNDPAKTVEVGFLGVSPGQELAKIGPVGTARQMGDLFTRSVSALLSFPQRVYFVVADMITGKPRDPNSPISIVGASRVAGEVATADAIPVPARIATWFNLLASVNLFVAVLNLVPLLPLDGGHIAGALYEALKRGIARLRRIPDPGPVDTARMLPIAYVVGGFLVIAGAALIIADVVSPIQLF